MSGSDLRFVHWDTPCPVRWHFQRRFDWDLINYSGRGSSSCKRKSSFDHIKLVECRRRDSGFEYSKWLERLKWRRAGSRLSWESSLKRKEVEGRRKKNVSTPMCTPEGNGNANNCATIILLSDFDVPEYPFGAGMMVKLQSSICSTTFNKKLCLL